MQRTRRSVKAFNVARDYLDAIKLKKPIMKRDIAVSNGYSLKSAIAQKPYRTQTFKEATEPILEVMRRVHAKAIMNLDSRNMNNERMDSVTNVAKQMVHDSQLLQGKATENVATNVVVYGDDDWLALQKSIDNK